MPTPDPRDGIPQFVAECRDRIAMLRAMFPVLNASDKDHAIAEIASLTKQSNEAQMLWDEWQMLKGAR
jgi:hypothetical protein